MQGVFLFTNLFEESKEDLLYCCYHSRNGEYLEREDEIDKFSIICSIDDTSSTVFFRDQDLKDLLSDIEMLIYEAKEKGDKDLCNHLKEIFVLCKLCLWNTGRFYLKFSPWGDTDFPDSILKKFRENISSLP